LLNPIPHHNIILHMHLPLSARSIRTHVHTCIPIPKFIFGCLANSHSGFPFFALRSPSLIAVRMATHCVATTYLSLLVYISTLLCAAVIERIEQQLEEYSANGEYTSYCHFLFFLSFCLLLANLAFSSRRVACFFFSYLRAALVS